MCWKNLSSEPCRGGLQRPSAPLKYCRNCKGPNKYKIDKAELSNLEIHWEICREQENSTEKQRERRRRSAKREKQYYFFLARKNYFRFKHALNSKGSAHRISQLCIFPLTMSDKKLPLIVIDHFIFTGTLFKWLPQPFVPGHHPEDLKWPVIEINWTIERNLVLLVSSFLYQSWLLTEVQKLHVHSGLQSTTSFYRKIAHLPISLSRIWAGNIFQS